MARLAALLRKSLDDSRILLNAEKRLEPRFPQISPTKATSRVAGGNIGRLSASLEEAAGRKYFTRKLALSEFAYHTWLKCGCDFRTTQDYGCSTLFARVSRNNANL